MAPECWGWGRGGQCQGAVFQKGESQKLTEVRVVSRFGKCLSNRPLVVRRLKCGQGVKDPHRNKWDCLSRDMVS